MNEVFKDVKGFEGYYQISNMGNIKSLKFGKERILKQNKSNGYYLIHLFSKGVQTSLRVHRLVADAFIPKPKNKLTINHINGIKIDNRLENLEWVTQGDNVRHAWEIGLNKGPQGEKQHLSKLTGKEILQVRDLVKCKRFKQTEIAKFYEVSSGTVSLIINRKIWKHI